MGRGIKFSFRQLSGLCFHHDFLRVKKQASLPPPKKRRRRKKRELEDGQEKGINRLKIRIRIKIRIGITHK